MNIVYGDENIEQKNRDIAAQLNFDGEASRDALLSDILQMGVLDDIPPPVRALYNCLEEEFAPLQLISRYVDRRLTVLENCFGSLCFHVFVTTFFSNSCNLNIDFAPQLKALRQHGEVNSEKQ